MQITKSLRLPYISLLTKGTLDGQSFPRPKKKIPTLNLTSNWTEASREVQVKTVFLLLLDLVHQRNWTSVQVDDYN